MPPRSVPSSSLALALACALVVVVLTAGCATAPPVRSMEQIFTDALDASRRAESVATACARSAANVPAVGEDAPFDLGPPVDIPAGGPLVSDTFVETDVREAVLSLAAQAGVGVVVDDMVRGATNAVISDEPFETALRRVLMPLGYVFRKTGDEYLVGSVEPNTALFPLIAQRHEFRPRYLKVEELLELLPTRSLAYVRSSAARNLILITAPAEIARRILGVLGTADQPVPQVMLEVIVCVYSPERLFELGLDFETGFGAGGNDFGNVIFKGLQTGVMIGPEQMAGLRSFRFTSAFLKALATEGYVGIRAAPRVMARDGEPAEIVMGEQTWFTIGDDRNLIRDLQAVQSGIVLSLVAKIRGSRVTVRIDRAEVSDEIRPARLLGGGDAELPTISNRRVSTTVEVRDGDTIVIGGLVHHRELDRSVQVPLVGDIPLLGNLARRTERRDEHTEIAIFISPRIVKEN